MANGVARTARGAGEPRRRREGANGRVARAVVPRRQRDNPQRDNPLRPPLWRRALRRAVRWTLVAVVLAVVAPFALLALYRWEAINPVSTLMVTDWLSGREVRREWVPLDAVSSNLVHAVAMSEDARFCRHDGVDWDAVSLVVEDALDGRRTRGASTIAMQTVKNLFLWPERSYLRKGLEVPLGLSADFILGKRRLMEIYLNVAEWGRDGEARIYGAEAAARHHFGRGAGRLSRRQGALLAVTLPNPKARTPGRPGKGLSRMARRVEARARVAGPWVRCLR